MPSWILLHTHSVIALIIGATQWGMLWFLLKEGTNIPIRRWMIINYMGSTIWYIDQIVRFSLFPGTEGSWVYKLETIFVYSPSLSAVMLANIQICYLFIESSFEKERKLILRWSAPICLFFVGANAWNELTNKSDVFTFQKISFLWGVITNVWILILSIRKYRKIRFHNPDSSFGILWLGFVAFSFLFMSSINAIFGLYSSLGYWTFFVFILLGSLTLIITYISYSPLFVSFQIKITAYSFVVVCIFIAILALVFFPPIDPRNIKLRLPQQEGLKNIFLLLILSILAIISILPVLIRRTLSYPLIKLYSAIQDVNDGNLSVEVPIIFRDEIGYLTQSFNEMTKTLRQNNSQLVEYSQTLMEMYANQQKVQEQTLNHVSQEIHDNVGQMLSLVKIQLNLAAQKNNIQNELIAEAQENIGRAMMDLRDLAKGMSSERIRVLGLVGSVEQEAERIRRTGSCLISIECKGAVIQLEHQKETILFRVIQECLQYTLKQSRATEILLSFNYIDQYLHINIKDNGKGFLVSRENNLIGMGLLNIHHRIKLMNGRIIIQSEPGIGTNLHIEVPLNS
jgi:signal transduction histidine kinase